MGETAMDLSHTLAELLTESAVWTKSARMKGTLRKLNVALMRRDA